MEKEKERESIDFIHIRKFISCILHMPSERILCDTIAAAVNIWQIINLLGSVLTCTINNKSIIKFNNLMFWQDFKIFFYLYCFKFNFQLNYDKRKFFTKLCSRFAQSFNSFINIFQLSFKFSKDLNWERFSRFLCVHVKKRGSHLFGINFTFSGKGSQIN